MNIGSCNLSSNSRFNAGTSNPARQSHKADFIPARLPSRVCKLVCRLLLLLLLLSSSLQRLSCVAGAEGEAERTRWSVSFDDYRRSFDSLKFLECESSGVLPDLFYDAERDQSAQVYGEAFMGQDWKVYWQKGSHLGAQKLSSQSKGAKLCGGFHASVRRALWSDGADRRMRSHKRPPRLMFNKQVNNPGKVRAQNGEILGTDLSPSSSSSSSSSSTLSMCHSDWAVCKNGVVVAINLSSRELTGPIPLSFSTLTSLEYMNLKNNSFTGSVPSWLGNLANLTTLDLSLNNLSGPIPESLGKSRSLRFLDISYNQLEGSIPELLDGMESLVVLKLGRNRLSGSIPNLCGLTRVRYISLGHNHLTGPIPTTIDCFRNLVILSLSHNDLVGPVPSQLSSLPLLRVLDLRSNQLAGSIPQELGSLQRLRVMLLQDNVLTGTVPSTLGDLRSLERLQLCRNQLQGSLPGALGMLWNLRVLDLSNNLFTGSLPDEFSLLSQLRVFNLNNTFVTGSIPFSYGNLGSLNILSLSANNISGAIPTSLGNLGELLYLDLESNNLTGDIPSSLARCTSLSHLLLSGNSLTGEVPATFMYLGSLRVVAMAHNNLTGALPAWGPTTPALEEIILPSNSFSGSIPPDWGALQFLRILALSFNNLTGPIPVSLVHCISLQQLWLDHNSLSGWVGEWLGELQSLVLLSLAYNRLEGYIPSSLSRCNQLQLLLLGSNLFSGGIPSNLEALSGLVVLSMSSNNLSGPIPPSLGSLQLLEGLDLDVNSLTGSPPPELMNLKSLRVLLLGHNNFTGPFPAWVTNLTELQALDLSFNNLEGEIPLGFTNLVHMALPPSVPSSPQPTTLFVNNPGLETLYSGTSRGQTYLFLAGNSLTGAIPSDFGRLQNLWVLDVRKNRLTDPIPASLSEASALNYLDLSENAINGSIPEGLQNLSFLSFFNVSINHLTGPIPDRGQFDTFGPDSYLGNWGLCGVPIGVPCTMPPMSTPPAASANVSDLNGSSTRHPGRPQMGVLVGIVLASVLGTWALLAVLVWWDLVRRRTVLTRVLTARTSLRSEDHWSPSKDALSINVAMFQKFLPKLTLSDLVDATRNFAIENVIGDGGFGTVYKATFQGDKVVAVKRLMGDKSKGEREFLAEMETLGKVKHTNIVPLLGYCSCGTDRLLIYDYMPNGNLDLWLHTSARVSAGRKALDWYTRLKIALGTARGVAFLHHVCIPHIIHRDIKASNILLDEDFNPYVSDFGLARLISAYDSHLSTTLAGTVGYIPPEYGQNPLASTRGDVYSFGVVLLQILTGRRPTDRFFRDKEDSDLINWVRHLVLQNKILEVFDPELIIELDTELVERVDRFAGRFECDSSEDHHASIHPHFFPGSSQGSSPISPFFSPDVVDLQDHHGRRVSHSAIEGRPPLRIVLPRRSLGCSSTSSPASYARPSCSAYSTVTGFEGIPEFECRFADKSMKRELITTLGLAVWCTEDVASKRPSMLQACKLLDSIVNTNQGGDDQ